MSTKIVKLKYDEFWPLLNVLNEVCHGIKILNFEMTIGVNKKMFIDFVDHIPDEECDEIILNLNGNEFNWIVNAFEEVFRQIDDWEFQTRIGITREETMAIKEKFRMQAL